MLCYSFLEKRGDHIKKYINWSLISENKIIVENKNVECEFVNNIVKYQEDKDTLNIVDLTEDIYIRENNEFTFKIDFKNRCFDYILKEQDVSINNAPIDAFIQKGKKISLKYNLENEEKEILIHLL